MRRQIEQYARGDDRRDSFDAVAREAARGLNLGIDCDAAAEREMIGLMAQGINVGAADWPRHADSRQARAMW